MNDPNGLVYYKGEYHLFFQYNPFGNAVGQHVLGPRGQPRPRALAASCRWRSRATATSWCSPAARSSTTTTRAGSGRARTRRWWRSTPAREAPASQAQALAYSTDDGRTWTKYSGNPVLDIGSGEFRDPKVFWYAPAHEWRMVGRPWPIEHKVAIYSSPNLKDWTHLSDFGPANATGGVWECPDLFPLAVDGNRRNDQVGDGRQPQPRRDRRRLRRRSTSSATSTARRSPPTTPRPYTPPAGDVCADFEGADYGGWTTTGTAFGSGPAHGTLPGQQAASRLPGQRAGQQLHRLRRLAPGTLTSPRLHDRPATYVNFLIGGGNHPHDPGATGDGSPPAGDGVRRLRGPDLRQRLDARPATSRAPRRIAGDHRRPAAVSGYEGSSWSTRSSTTTTRPPGTIVSPEFTITSDYIDFADRRRQPPEPGDPDPTVAVNLVVDGQVVRTATGQRHRDAQLEWPGTSGTSQGKRAHIEIVDQSTGGWGHVLADHFVLSDIAAKIRSDETAVNLLVDGQVVRSSDREGQRGARLGELGRRRPQGQGRADPDRRPQQRRLGAHPRRPVHVRRRRPRRAAEQRAQLGRLRQGLLRRGHLQRRARRAAHRDRLDEQLELRRRHPDRRRGAAR